MRLLDLRKLIILRALDGVVQDKHSTMVARFKDEYILVFGFLVVQNIVDFEGHCLARPHIANLSKPAIWKRD